jgi:16S rRNA (cytidine1402-2'-O)-methyltransferase
MKGFVMSTPTLPGTLTLVPTPLGNLGDMTLRAISTLETADVVAAEDTRRTRALLSHLGIKKPVVSCYRHNEIGREAWLLKELAAGHQVALVSDAGMPGVCDPGSLLAAVAREAGYPVIVLPGPSAVLLALVYAGFPCDSFTFGGYLPRHRKARTAVFAALVPELRTAVFFETPHRLRASLADCAATLPGRQLVVAREMTKLHQEIFRGSAAEAAAHFSGEIKGEIVLVIAGATPESLAAEAPPSDPAQAQAMYRELVAQGLHPKKALKEVGSNCGITRQEAYRLCRTPGEDAEKGE